MPFKNIFSFCYLETTAIKMALLLTSYKNFIGYCTQHRLTHLCPKKPISYSSTSIRKFIQFFECEIGTWIIDQPEVYQVKKKISDLLTDKCKLHSPI